MPTLRSPALVSIGLLIGLSLSALIYLFHQPFIQPLVYTTYVGLINSLQLYELAWILATIDYLLNITLLSCFFLWFVVTVIVSLLVRKTHATLTILSAAILLPAGTWLLFAIKYAPVAGFPSTFLLLFLFWQVLFPIAFVLGLASLLSLPFYLMQRQQPPIAEAPKILTCVCRNCGATYRSQPLICVQCGQQGTIEMKIPKD